jgi:hypothetical protein
VDGANAPVRAGPTRKGMSSKNNSAPAPVGSQPCRLYAFRGDLSHVQNEVMSSYGRERTRVLAGIGALTPAASCTLLSDASIEP